MVEQNSPNILIQVQVLNRSNFLNILLFLVFNNMKLAFLYFFLVLYKSVHKIEEYILYSCE